MEHLSPGLLDSNGWALLLSTPYGGDWFSGVYRRAKTDSAYGAQAPPMASSPLMSKECQA